MPSILCANPSCPREGEHFYARTRRALYCSDACKKAAARSQPLGSGRRIANPVETLDRLQEKHGFPQGEPPDANWVKTNDVTHKLMRRKRPDVVLGYVVDWGPHWASDFRVRWGAVVGEDSVSPNDIEACGYRADLSTAKAIVEAYLSGRLAPLVVKNLHEEDCTEDAWLELRGMLSLLGRTQIRTTEDSSAEDSTEDFSTDEQIVVRLNRYWAVVLSGEGDCWVLQHRIGEGDVWEQAGRFKHRKSLIHTIEQQAGQVTPEAMTLVLALPEKP